MFGGWRWHAPATNEDVKTRSLLATLATAALLLTAACSDDEPKPLTGSSLRLVAGSEQETVLNTIVKPWCEAKKYDCRFTLKGSVDQARLLSSGSKDYDAYWFASSVFSQLGDKGGSLQDVKSMFLTPIVSRSPTFSPRWSRARPLCA
jgi:Ca-activated chloride channel family protein